MCLSRLHSIEAFEGQNKSAFQMFNSVVMLIPSTAEYLRTLIWETYFQNVQHQYPNKNIKYISKFISLFNN